MPKTRNSGKGFIRVIKAKKPKKSKKSRSQKGGKINMPMRYFNANHNNHYYNAADLVANGGVNPQAVSQGNYNGTVNSVGPQLYPGVGLNRMTGGGVLPAEYFGGNSGRYFAAGSPELQNCTTAYGVAVPTSHGVVMGGENAGFMGPNLAAFPNWLDMTGGSRKTKRKRKQKKSKKRQSKKQKKNKGRK